MIVRCVSSGSTSRNTPSRWPCVMMSRTATNTSFINWNVCGVEVRRAGGELAQHDRGEPRAGGGFLDDGGDPRVELVLGRARTVGDGAGAAADRPHHLAHALRGKLALAAEVVVEHRLVDAGAGGDAVGAGGVVAALGEFDRRGAEDGAARVARGAPLSSDGALPDRHTCIN